MKAFQSIVESLLLETGASRAMFERAGADGEFTPVAEAVTHGARQIRNDNAAAELREPAALHRLQSAQQPIVEDNLERADPAVPRALIERYGARARIQAPVIHRDRLAGVLTIHRVADAGPWKTDAQDALRRAQAAAAAELAAAERNQVPMTADDLRDAALQAILDRVRLGLRVQRCTLRQNVSAAYAFPVTHESRGEGIWSLRGDFTIIQSGQPVIEKMLKDRMQVVQNDTRNASAEPLFHVMLQHYGDMRAQIVTPLFREDSLAAVLSVHSLQELRDWTPAEIALARSGARMLGLLIGATLA